MALFTSAAIASFLGIGAGFLSTVSAIALNAAVGIGLQLAVQSLDKPKAAEPIAVRGKMQSGGDVARSIIMGRRATAGSLVYANTWGKAGKTPNAYFSQVIALSDMPVTGLTAMWVNGEPVTVKTSDAALADTFGYPIEEYRDDGKDHLWVKFHDGKQTVADQFVVSSVASEARPYEATRVGLGVAYVVVTARSNPDLFSGFPAFRFEVQGMPLYDISKDSTAGGSGTQRWDTPSTWGGDGDDYPVVQVYNIMRGIRYGSDWLYGLQGTPAARFPASDWVTQIGKCRLKVDGPSGKEAQYMTGAEISVDNEIAATVEALLMGCQGRPIETGGIYKVRVGEPGAANFTFSDDDIISTEQQTGKPFIGLADSVNGITASYPEPAEAWNTKVAPALYSPDYETRDGNRRLVSDLDLTAVSRSRQVHQIMKAALAEARRERRHTLVLPPGYWTVEPGDVAAWSSARNGYAAKLFRVDGVADHANLDVMIDVTEVDPTDYNYDYFTDYRPPVFVPVKPGKPPAQPIYGWTVLPAVIYDASGNPRRPSIKVGCAPDQDDVAKVWVKVRLKSTGQIVFDSDSTPYASPYEWVLNGTFLPATQYQVQGKLVPYTRRKTSWTDWIDVTTPDVKLAPGLDYDPYSGVIDIDQLGEDLKGYHEWLSSGRRDLLDRLDEIALLVADQDLGNAIDRQQLRKQITATFQGARAEYLQKIDVLVTADAAMASLITSLSATINKNRADYVSQVQVLVTSDLSLSQSIDTLSSNFGGFQSSVSSQLVSLTNADSALSLRADQLQAKVNDPDTGLSANASAISGLQTRVSTAEGKITATADSVNDLDVSVGKFSASGRFRTTVEATPSGAQARIGLSVAASSGGATASAAMYLDALAGGQSRVVFEADQFIVVAGGNLNNPFIVDGTAVRMNVANIGTVTAGILRSSDSKMVINLNAGTIVISS
jgi:hypothetical protein